MSDSRAIVNRGELRLDKGLARKDTNMYAWDSIPMCNPTTCPVAEQCNYLTPGKAPGKCSVQVAYLDALYECIFTSYPYLDNVALFKIGMQVVPLYLHLAKMQLFEMSLGEATDPMVFHTEKGEPKIHPIYKEIRETMKAIHVMWQDLDLTLAFNGKANPKGEGTGAPGEVTKTAGDPVKGNPGFYDQLTKADAPKRGIIR